MQQKEKVMEEKDEAQSFFESTTGNKPDGINGRVFKIKVLNWNSFSIGDTRNFSEYQGNGLCQNIKMPKKVDFEPFEKSMKEFDKTLDPNFGIYDFEKMGDNFSIFASFMAYSEFKSKNKRLPKNWSLEDAKEFEETVVKIAKSHEKDEKEMENIAKFARKFSFICEAELPSIGAYMGGLVSQEVIKGITNKFSPIKQFFTFHLNEMIPEIEETEEKIK